VIRLGVDYLPDSDLRLINSAGQVDVAGRGRHAGAQITP
jgi:hypothetical protein